MERTDIRSMSLKELENFVVQDLKDKKIVSRYFTVIILMAIVGIAILFKAMSVMIFERNYWREVASRSVVDSAQHLILEYQIKEVAYVRCIWLR